MTIGTDWSFLKYIDGWFKKLGKRSVRGHSKIRQGGYKNFVTMCYFTRKALTNSVTRVGVGSKNRKFCVTQYLNGSSLQYLVFINTR